MDFCTTLVMASPDLYPTVMSSRDGCDLDQISTDFGIAGNSGIKRITIAATFLSPEVGVKIRVAFKRFHVS